MADAAPWVEVRCQSPMCDRVGGRLLFKRRGDLVVHACKAGGSLIAVRALGAICRCGAAWRDPSLGPTPMAIDPGLRVT